MGAWDFLKVSNGNGKKPFNVLVTLCVHRGVDPDAFESLFMLSQCPNPRFLVKVKSGDALIDRSRSIVATKFMENANYDLLFFIDDDILFDPRDVMKISRLCHEQNLGIVGGAYVKKAMQNTNYAIKTFEGYEYTFGQGGACEEVEHVSTGFMCIQKRVFKEMIEKLPDEIPYCEHGGFDFYPFFQPYPKKLENGKHIYLSEDWSLTDRWKRLGGKVYCDMSVRLKHAGRYLFEDNDMLRPPKPDYRSFKYFEDDDGSVKVEGIETEIKVA